MNNVIINNATISDIEYSHTTGGTEYSKAFINIDNIYKNSSDIIVVKFKTADNPYNNGEVVDFQGQLRSHNYYTPEKSFTEIYVSTDFTCPLNKSSNNIVDISGRICLKKELVLDDNKCYLKFILANNIFSADKKLNSYIPCIAYGKAALEISDLDVGSLILIEKGKLKSKIYQDLKGMAKVSYLLCFTLYEPLDVDIDNEV